MKDGGKKIKLSKAVASVLISVSVLIIFIVALLITEIYIPVKYLTAYFVKAEQNRYGILRVNYVNVGFGDCILIELPDGKTALIDGGDGAYPNTLSALKVLNSRGVKKIDYLICSSVKPEHCGGLSDLVEYKDIGYAFIPYCLNTRITSQYRSFINKLDEKGVPRSYACVGEGISGEGYFLTFLSPCNYLSPNGEYASLNKNPSAANIENASAVIWLEYGETSFAFTSDVRSEGLKRIVEDYKISEELNQPYCAYKGNDVNLKNCDIITAAGHGGEDNTYAPWYDLTKPEQAIISVGKNYSGYPSNVALSDICNYCNPLYTMYDGDITVTADAEGYKIL